MKEKLSQRLEELKVELKTGHQLEAEFEGKLAQLRTTLLGISGAIQVLEEILASDHAAPPPASQPQDAAISDDGGARILRGRDIEMAAVATGVLKQGTS